MCSRVLSDFRTLSTVLFIAPMPSRARNSACSGTRTASTATSAFSVTRPSDGGQSIRMVSHRARALLPGAVSASASRCSRRSMSISSISAPASDWSAGMTERPGIALPGWSFLAGRGRGGIRLNRARVRFCRRPVRLRRCLAGPGLSEGPSRRRRPRPWRDSMAVVVLPTPPFWLAIAKTLGAELGNSEENGVTVGHAGKGLGLSVPVLHGLGQFEPASPLPLWKRQIAVSDRCGSLPKRGAGRAGARRPGGHDVGLGGGRGLDPADDRLFGWFFRPIRRPASARKAPLRASDSIRRHGEGGPQRPRGPGRESRRRCPDRRAPWRPCGIRGQKLCRIEDVAGPDLVPKRGLFRRG